MRPVARAVLCGLTPLVLLSAAGCGSSAPSRMDEDAAFRERDKAMLRQLQESRAEYEEGELPREAYERKLGTLETAERSLFEEVRKHTFTDITEYNYWHRSRLKFPSAIESARSALQSAPAP